MCVTPFRPTHSLKNTETGEVAAAYFGRIPAHGSDLRNLQMDNLPDFVDWYLQDETGGAWGSGVANIPGGAEYVTLHLQDA